MVGKVLRIHIAVIVFTFRLMLLPLFSQAQPAVRHDVIITELYPDPDSRNGLPAGEFIELQNISNKIINLKGWKLKDAGSTATITESFDLKPDSFLVICPASTAVAYKSFGTTISVTGFPSLNNDEDNIILYNAEGQIIHNVHYNLSWYQNDVKKDGGWTIEMIDNHSPCTGASNWKASEHPKGGTPGQKNSVSGSNPDDHPPALLHTYIKDNFTLVAVFDESLDSSTAARPSAYTLGPAGVAVAAAMPVSPDFKEVVLGLNTAFKAETVYNLTVSNVTDCSGNLIGTVKTAKCGLPSDMGPGDLIINEILFNPAGAGYDYVELYNNSNKICELQKISLAGKNSTGQLVNAIAVSVVNRLLYPGEYIVITEDDNWLSQNYLVKNRADICRVTDLPSLPDDKGYLALLDNQGKIIDDINYSDKWHFALINNKDGVAIERIDYSQPTNEKTNWTSAASAAGFGTPGYQNSQFRADLQAQGTFLIEPKLFSPDNDGYDDVAAFKYEMAEPGYMGSITIYDGAGRPVRYLVKNALLGLKSVVNWDGLDENSKKLPVGVYIVFMEIFNLKGRIKKFKHTVILARKF